MVRDQAVEELPTIQELRSIGLYCGVTEDLYTKREVDF
jgi:hypothetical protein